LTVVFGVVATVSLVVLVSASVRAVPRCPRGLVALGPRCCGEGQTLRNGACVGAPTRCSDGLSVTPGGCVAPVSSVVVGRGASSWRPPDDMVGSPGEHVVAEAFGIDRIEVTWSRYASCVAAGRCAEIAPASGGDAGQAISGVTLAEARAFCAYAGGRLPRDAEWLRVALGEVEKRYPWGDPDAFCTRASYGLVDGPCGDGAQGPDTAGARPFGATPIGVLDVAGNVAELVDDGAPPGMAAVRGGSFAESESSSLRARWRRLVPLDARLPSVGFRCAYDAPATP
jgi:formylglycine-generating enzyme